MSVLGTIMEDPVGFLFTGSRNQLNSAYAELFPHSPASPHYETPQASTVNLRQPIPKRQKPTLRRRMYLHGIGMLTDFPSSASVKSTLRID